MTYQNIGQWKTAANDLIGTVLAAGAQRATPGWVSGQRWSASAQQWGGAAWDPGNVADSYTDAIARLWSATANLWRSAARDVAGTVAGLATPGWVSGQLWSTSAVQWQSKDATDLANYNNLLNGLNSPDGLTTVAIATGALPTFGTGGTTTLTIPRTGHFMWAIDARVAVTLSSQGSFITFNVSGIATDTRQTTFQSNAGSPNVYYGLAGHGDYTAGQTLTISFSTGDPVASAFATGTLYAHFIPNATNHN